MHESSLADAQYRGRHDHGIENQRRSLGKVKDRGREGQLCSLVEMVRE